MSLEIVPREAWGARPAADVIPNYTEPITNVFVMNVKTMQCFNDEACKDLVYKAQCFNMELQRQKDIRVNFLIGENGMIYEGRGWSYIPSLPLIYNFLNKTSLLIGFIGSHQAEELTTRLTDATTKLVEMGIKNNYIAENFAYHDITSNRFRPFNTSAY